MVKPIVEQTDKIGAALKKLEEEKLERMKGSPPEEKEEEKSSCYGEYELLIEYPQGWFAPAGHIYGRLKP